jgi:two-component system, NarL family, response regulator
MMSQTTTIRVLIADDHAIFRQGLATIINRDPDMQVIAQAENGEQAIALFEEHRPDVTLMDLRMPKVAGVAAIGAICAAAKSARIIVLTTYDSDEDIYRGLQAGAKGYLLKETEVYSARCGSKVGSTPQQSRTERTRTSSTPFTGTGDE